MQPGTEPAPPPPRHRRLGRLIVLALLTLLFAVGAWFGWREYDYREAIRITKSYPGQQRSAGIGAYCFLSAQGGFTGTSAAIPDIIFEHDGPFHRLQENWRALLSKDTWESDKRHLEMFGPETIDFATEHDLFRRLRPTKLTLKYPDAHRVRQVVSAMTDLQSLEIESCPGLDDLRFLAGLESLEELRITNCPDLRDISALRNLRTLKKITFNTCNSLNSDVLIWARSTLLHAEIAVNP
jgi:hypothetical protein